VIRSLQNNEIPDIFSLFFRSISLVSYNIALNVSFYGSASGEQYNTLQWFPSLAADNGTVYIVWADERNSNYTRIMNDQPHKSGDIYISRGSFQDGWVFDKNIRIMRLKELPGTVPLQLLLKMAIFL